MSYVVVYRPFSTIIYSYAADQVYESFDGLRQLLRMFYAP